MEDCIGMCYFKFYGYYCYDILAGIADFEEGFCPIANLPCSQALPPPGLDHCGLKPRVSRPSMYCLHY